MRRSLLALRALVYRRRAELRLAARVVTAGLIAHALTTLFGLPQGFWAVISAVIVMQASVGGSLKASVDRMIGTFGGAIYGGILDGLIPHEDPWALALVLALALGPLALLAAIDDRFRIAPITAIIIILAPSVAGLTPIQLTVDRILEILLGGVVAVAVSLFVFPARANVILAESVVRLLNLLADSLAVQIAGLEHGADPASTAADLARSRAAVTALDAAGREAQRERRAHLSGGPDPDPIVRTAMRLRNDLVIVARSTAEPLAPAVYARLAPSLKLVAVDGAEVLRSTADAFLHRTAPPALQPLDEALDGFSAALAQARAEGLTAGLPSDSEGRLFGLGFGLDQMRSDLNDMVARYAEFAAPSSAGTPAKPSAA